MVTHWFLRSKGTNKIVLTDTISLRIDFFSTLLASSTNTSFSAIFSKSCQRLFENGKKRIDSGSERGTLPPENIAQGTGLNNMMRQLGGSFGVALVTTYIHRSQAEHRNALLSNINEYNPAFNERFQLLYNNLLSKGFDARRSRELAMKAIDGTVLKQTYLMTYTDTFWFIGAFFVICIPLIYLQKFNRTAKVPVDAH